MENGFPVVSPVTVQIREADWERLVPKLRGVKTVFICQDNEVSDAGMHGALKTARVLAAQGITTRIVVLPLGEKQRRARERLAGLAAGNGEADTLLADAKIDVNEYFASGRTASDFESLLAAAQTPLDGALATLDSNTPDNDLSRRLDPIMREVGRLPPIEQERYLRAIQSRCGRSRLPVNVLRQQLKVVVLDAKTRAKHERSARTPEGVDAGKPAFPRIRVNDRQLREIVSDAWGAIHNANQPGGAVYPHAPFLFQRAGQLVRLAIGEFGPSIDEMNEDAVYGLLARTADWFKALEDANVETSPSRDAAKDMIAYPDLHLPILEGVISTPVFGRKGELILTEGYHADDRLWMWPDTDLEVAEIPAAPELDETTAARGILFDELLVDFPFVDVSDRAHTVAAMILPFVRRLIDAPTPMHLIEAPTMGSGKGLLANLISIVTTGSACEARTLPESEDEIRKMLTAELMRGRPIILLDNASERKQLYSSSLASVLTSVRWTDRKLGQSSMASVPNHALWLMTANNPNLHLEITRRCVRIRIDPRVDRPWKRSGFKHPDVAEWARQNRPALVRAILTLIRAWMAAGKPRHTVRLGSFEAWSTTMGGILEVGGIEGFLASLDQLYESADIEGQMWREFTAAWWAAFRDTPKKVSDLNDLCESQELMLRTRGDGSAKSQQTRLGSALSSHRDRVFDGKRIVKLIATTAHKGPTQYRLEPDGAVGLGTLGTFGDLDAKGPQTLMPFESIGSEEIGDLGDLEGFTNACAGKSLRVQ